MTRYEILEAPPVKDFHRDEGSPTLLAYVVDGTDIGMVQDRGSLGLALEALQRVGVSCCIVWEEFESNNAM